jgi:serine/threonine protein kinase
LALELSKDGACIGRAGTLRYMAPEVAANKAYGLSADVFSFAVLLWQIVTSRIPYKAEISTFTDTTPQVDGIRPPLKYVESKDLQLLLEKSWASTPDDRPKFTEIGVELRKMISMQLLKLDREPRKKEKQGQPQRKLLRSVFSR